MTKMRRTKWGPPKRYTVGLWGPMNLVRMIDVAGKKNQWLPCTRTQFARLRKAFEDNGKQPMTLDEAKKVIEGLVDC